MWREGALLTTQGKIVLLTCTYKGKETLLVSKGKGVLLTSRGNGVLLTSRGKGFY